MKLSNVLAFAAAAGAAGCGTLTGLPAHGGGKRFAIEQEVVSASARAAARNLDLHSLEGRRAALYVTVIGDEGSGSFLGGRYTLDALVRGSYINAPSVETNNTYPTTTTTATTTSGSTTSTTVAEQVLNAPSQSVTNSDGLGTNAGIAVQGGGLGAYQNETLITNPRDVTYLTNLLQTVFFLRGVDVVPPAQADTDVFVTVDVFGTIRSRTDWHLLNEERLAARTKLEVFAVDRATRTVIMAPTSSSFEASYEEEYALWAGPYRTTTEVHETEPLIVSFSDLGGPLPSARFEGPSIPLATPPATDQTPIERAIESDRR